MLKNVMVPEMTVSKLIIQNVMLSMIYQIKKPRHINHPQNSYENLDTNKNCHPAICSFQNCIWELHLSLSVCDRFINLNLAIVSANESVLIVFFFKGTNRNEISPIDLVPKEKWLLFCFC